MELELKREFADGYRSETPILLSLEETAETVVPDHDPDVARIVDVSACLLLQDQSVADGRLTASGSVALTLLYLSEETTGLRALEYRIPYEHRADLPDGCTDACLEGSVCHVEARLLNPRKFFTRLDVDWRITPYRAITLATCSEISEREDYSIQTLCETYDVSLIRSLKKSEFVFADELTLPGGKETIAELLRSHILLRLTEAKPLGSKLVLKGAVCLSLLYAGESGTLFTYAEELPFSQIMDRATGGAEGDDLSAALALADSEIRIGTDSDRSVSVRLLLNSFVVCRSTQSVCCISDLYSTSCELDAQMESVALWRAPVQSTVTQSVREQLNTGTEVTRVLSVDVCFSGAGTRREGERAVFFASAAVTLLYLDEADTPLSLRRRLDISADAPYESDVQVCMEAVCAEEVTANINPDGVELRFPARFLLTRTESHYCACLSRLSIQQRDGSDAPLLVLRALEEGETLWDVAKQYRTTVETILNANELSESSVLEAGRMLLIPRSR